MRSFWQQPTRDAAIARLARLTPEARPAWGRMSAPQVVAHLADALRMAFGDLATQPKRVPLLRAFPLKHLVIYVLPFPKGAPTATELITRAPGAWEAERGDCRALVERFATEPRERAWPAHPAFGRLSAEQWGIIAWRHMDHHLRQFGA